MRSFVLLLIALMAFAQGPDRSRPAPANPFIDDGRVPGPSPWHNIRAARRQIDRAREGGLLTRREARQLRREARLIGALAYRYGRDGLSASEAGEIRTRTELLRANTERARRTRNGG